MFACAPAFAENWAAEQRGLPIDVRPAVPIVAEPGDALVVRGVVSGKSPALVVIRMDDGRSSDYASRVNVERLLPPGPFIWHFPLAGATAANGRVLDPRDIRRLMLFDPAGDGRVAIDEFSLEPGQRFPDGAVGYSLGSRDAPLIGGLVRLTPDDPRVFGGHPVAVRRPSPDPVIANGIIGLERLRLDWPRGRARVSLWIEDVGEWETLPHPLQRRVRVNGRDVVSERLSAEQWIAERYLAGRDREASVADDAWTAHGRFRGGLVSADVDVGDDGVTIELAGDGAESTFLAAVVIEPAGQSAALDAVLGGAPAMDGRELSSHAAPPGGRRSDLWESCAGRVAATRCNRAWLRRANCICVGGPGLQGRPKVSILAPTLDGSRLNLDLYAAQWRLDRTATGANLLARTNRILHGDPASLPILPDEPRRYVAWVERAERTRNRDSIAERSRFDAGGALAVPVEVEVLPVDLPQPASPAGFYLDEAPHLTWFEATRGDRGRQLGCDLATPRPLRRSRRRART